jgi:putative peptidoglycan lipid II flippase
VKRVGLLGHLVTFQSWTLASRVLGLARDVVVGAIFGPSGTMDAFLVAFKVPNFMRRLFAEGAFAQAFVPVLSQWRETASPAEVRRLISHVAGTLALVLIALTALGVAGAESVARAFAPGWPNAQPEQFALAVDLLRWTFPYLLLISLTACAGAVLNTWGSFGPPAFAPVLLNLSLIAAAVWLAPLVDPPIWALALAVVMAGILQLLAQLPFLAHHGVLVAPWPDPRHPGVRRILRLMGPTLFSVSVQQINLLVDTILASFLVAGSISWLYWADRLVEFPLGLFGVALGTVILPRLSGEHGRGEPEAFTRTLDWSLQLTLIIVLPATVGLIGLAVPLMATLFQYGAFSGTDVLAAGLSLMSYALGLAGFVLVRILTPGFFSRQDTRTPVRCAAIAMVFNMVLSAALTSWLVGSGVGHVGLAWATGMAACLNAALLYRGLRRGGHYTPQAGWQRLVPRVLLATLAMAAWLYVPGSRAELWLDAGVGLRVAMLTATVGLGAGIYAGVLLAAGLRPRELRAPAG